MKKTSKKILFEIIIIISVLSSTVPSVCLAGLAEDIVNPILFSLSPVYVIQYLFNDVLKKGQEDTTEAIGDAMDTINKLEYKVDTPSVDIVFDPVVPVPGQRITANAQTGFFKNPAGQHFYTWMLRHEEPGDGNKNKEDIEEDITEDNLESYKKNAAKIIANGGFDWIDATKTGKYTTDASEDPDNDGYDASDFFGGADQEGRKSINDYYCFVFNKNTGLFYPNDKDAPEEKHEDDGGQRRNKYGFRCRHFFPEECDGFEPGDGDFTTAEEKCWQTDPNDEDTRDSGNADEANVIGLGINSFSWTYQEGDMVGVAVEGVSTIPTKIDNGSYKVMWAISGNGCPNDDEENTDIEKLKDINDKCFPHSFVDPTEKRPGEKIDIILNYLPEFPSNSTKPEDAAPLSIEASVDGATNYENLIYTWKVYGVDNPDDPVAENWTLLNSQLKYPTPLSGPGVDTLKFGLSFADPPKFLKVSVDVAVSSETEMTFANESAYVIIPLSSETERLKVYSASASGDDAPILSTPGPAGCLDPNKLCQVSQNEIIAVESSDSEYTNFHWTINGTSLTSNPGPGGKPDGYKIFFPVTEKPGSEFILIMTAEKKATAEKVVIKKTFAVMEPTLEISSKNTTTCAPALLGYFSNLDGTETPDYSRENFEATVNSTVELEAIFSGPPLENFDDIEWTLPDADTSGKTAQFTTGTLGDSYIVQAHMLYHPNRNIQKALLRYWNISYDQYYETDLNAAIRIDTVSKINADGAGGDQALRTNKKPLASLISGIPAYFIFLFKIILTVGLLIFLLGIFSSLAFKRERE